MKWKICFLFSLYLIGTEGLSLQNPALLPEGLNVNLSQIEAASVLHPDVQVISLGEEDEAGKIPVRSLAPSSIWSNERSHPGSGAVNDITISTHQGILSNAIVEVLIVCDKEFGDIFQHNLVRILDYFTVYFWDANNRFKTLPSSNIEFRVVGVIVMESAAAQPFIERARGADGRANLNTIINLFSTWIYSKLNSVPQFDMAVAFSGKATMVLWRRLH